MKKLATALLVLLLACAGSGAGAAELGIYVTFEPGLSTSYARRSEFDAAYSAPYEAVENAFGIEFFTLTDSSLDQTDFSYSLALGYQFREHLAVEVAYLNLGRISYRTNAFIQGVEESGVIESHSIASSGGMTTAVIGTWSPRHRWQVEARVGAYLGQQRYRTRDDTGGTLEAAARARSTTSRNFSLLLGGAAAFSLNESADLSLGYTWFHDVGGERTGRIWLGYRQWFMRGYQ